MNTELLLMSAVVSALVGGFVRLRVSERKIQLENITQERAKWREQIRVNAQKVHQSASRVPTPEGKTSLAELRLVFKLLLNPLDPEDIDILKCIERHF